MSRLTLAKAKEILKKHTTEPSLFTHAACVSAAMGALADYYHEDKDYWEAIGWLHDVDYEKFPSEHCHHVRELLAPEGVDEEDIRIIISHGYGVVTEYGVAHLRGRNLAERARALIAVAHPSVREELERAAAERFGYSFLRLK